MLKNWIRDSLPASIQVPVKFWLNRIRSQLEPELQLLPYIVKRGASVIDIGGNRGTYAYALWRLGAKVEVFEPNPSCAYVLSSWAVAKKVLVHVVALSSKQGVAELHIPVDASGIEHDASASLEHENFVQVHNIQVKLQTLDSFGFSVVDLVKIDVEGHETDVLLGAEETIRSSIPALLIEIEQRHNDRSISEIFDQINVLGYQGFFLDENKLRPLQEFVLERDQSPNHFGVPKARYINNFLFLHQSRIEQGAYQSLLQTWQRA